MIDLPYNLVIEASGDPSFFTYYSPQLPEFTGYAHSVEECIYNAGRLMPQHITALRDQERPIPIRPQNPTIVIQNAEALTT